MHYINSFIYSIKGLIYCVRYERNFRVLCVAAIFIFSIAPVMAISTAEWAVLLICCGIVIAAEMLNTSIETLADYLTTEYNEKIKIIKDVASGAVFILVFISTVIFIMIGIFEDRFLVLFDFIKENFWYAILLIFELLLLIPAFLLNENKRKTLSIKKTKTGKSNDR